MAIVLAEMSWPAIKEELEEGNRTVLIPTASIEQHGPGLPLAVDTLRAEELGEGIADEVGCFLAPTIRPGVSKHHMGFPGTISLSTGTFQAVVSDYCRSLDAHGFEQIIIITTHGGNRGPLSECVPELDEELEARVFSPGTIEGYTGVRLAAAAEHGFSEHVAGLHGGAAETSFIMETNPHLVDRGVLAEGYVGEVEGEDVIERGLEAFTENGVLGDQRPATRAAGRTIIDACVRYYAESIEEQMSR